MIIQGEQIITIKIEGPLYVPFHNVWLKNCYTLHRAFHYNPFTIRAQSSSGSPVVLGASTFVGFLKDQFGTFSFDGRETLTVHIGKHQAVYIEERCDPWAAWAKYNQILTQDKEEDRPAPGFWKDVEYCTWVEQKKVGLRRKLGHFGALDETFVYEYLQRLARLKLPKGKFTIDHGWAIAETVAGEPTFGDWEIDRSKFPHFERMIHHLTEEGYTPGLWFAGGWITRHAKIARLHPDWVGIPFASPNENDAGVGEEERRYFVPSAELKNYYVRLYQPFVQMGIRKFKFDMYYENKSTMKQLLKLNYEALKELDPHIEVEIHIPDFFVSRFGDTVRMNDVWIDPDEDWRGLTYEHYRVCKYSAPDKIINLDHVGSNNQDVSEADFMEHWSMLQQYEGYPVISLLPDHYSNSAMDRFRVELLEKAQSFKQK